MSMLTSSRLLAAGVTVFAGVAALAVAAPAQAEEASCSPAGSTGLTAAVVAHAGQRVSGTIDAAGCDVGVYVGPAAAGARVVGATVTGANDHGIFVQDAAGVVIAGNTVTGNGVHRNAAVPEDKAIELAGTFGAYVAHNRVVGNDGGGIGLADDGPLDPGAVVGHPGAARPSAFNEVVGNTLSGNLNDCGIVVTAKNAGTGAFGNTVGGNVLSDTPGVFPPALSGIVLAGLHVDHNTIVGNTVHGSFMPGIILHSSRPETEVDGNVIADNSLSADDWGQINGPDARVAIILATASTPAGDLSGTVIANNSISSDEDYGIYLSGAGRTIIAADHRNQAAVPVFRS
jgi:parallel beta-helix repeat protein